MQTMTLAWVVLFVVVGGAVALPKVPVAKPTGFFWQLTDVHWDREYSPTGDPKKMCHQKKGISGSEMGKYGTYSCDSPWELVEASISAMAQRESNPDFIVWTGDNTPHVKDPVPDWDYVFSSLRKVTELLKDQFPRSQIIPVLGNHDVYPEDFYPGKTGGIYEAYLKEGGWEDLLSHKARGSFGACGFYATMPNKAVKVLVLNTNLYNVPDNLTNNIEDPCGQFMWMERELKKAELAGTKVLIAAHIPPGYFERFVASPFYNEHHNKKYINLLNDFGHVILAHVYGHTHTDSFRLFRNHERDEVKSVAFIAPSVTPWLHSGGVNPSVRLYSYHPSESHITDFWQYYLNLTEVSQHLTNKMADTRLINPDENLLAEKNRMYRSWAVRPVEDVKPYLDSLEENDLEIIDKDYYRHSLLKSVMKMKLKEREPAHKRVRRSDEPGWKLLYRATEFYNIPDLKSENMLTVYNRLKVDEDFFGQYYSYNTGGYVFEACNSTCKREHICAMGHLHNWDMEYCLSGKPLLRLTGPSDGKISEGQLPSNDSEDHSSDYILKDGVQSEAEINEQRSEDMSSSEGHSMMTVVSSVVFIFCVLCVMFFFLRRKEHPGFNYQNWRNSYEPIDGNIL